jgi:glycosyltransferase involved in cell wall biosynthesis
MLVLEPSDDVAAREGGLSRTSDVAFIYWGRRGAMCRLTLEAARAARAFHDLNVHFSISTTNQLYPEFRQFGDAVFPVDTFRSAPDVLLKAFSIFDVRRKLVRWLKERGVKSVVVLMPHLWTPLVADAVKREGIHYAVIIHDAKPHPGDPTGSLMSWLLRDASAADTVFTLSNWVASQLVDQGTVRAERIKTLFMPDDLLPTVGRAPLKGRRTSGQPLRILFFGRLLRYKGLDLFVDAMEILAAERIPIKISVCGEGGLGRLSSRLVKLGAEVINRWLSDVEVGQMLVSHDLMVLTHTEASQSGGIAAALGAGVPVVTTPVGGLAEQVRSRGAGLVAEKVDARSIADCIRALAFDPARYDAIVDQISSTDGCFSVARFMRELVAALPSQRG